MPKYWVKNYFAHGRFPEVGQKQKTEKREREKERKRERLNDGDNNGQSTHGARKHAWRTQAAWAKKNRKLVITMAKLCIAHASRLGQYDNNSISFLSISIFVDPINLE